MYSFRVFVGCGAHPRAACPPCRAAPDRYFRMIDRSLRKKRHTPPSPPDLHISDRTPTASSPGHTRQRSASGWRGRDQRRGRARAPVTEARRLALGRAVLGTRGCAPHTIYKKQSKKAIIRACTRTTRHSPTQFSGLLGTDGHHNRLPPAPNFVGAPTSYPKPNCQYSTCTARRRRLGQ